VPYVPNAPRGNPGADCIDRACCRHDCCVKNWKEASDPVNKFACDCNLSVDAVTCLKNCKTAVCRFVAGQVAAVFCSVCANDANPGVAFVLPYFIP